MKRLLALAAVAMLAGCTRPENAAKILKREGYTDVRVGGYSFFGCDDGDTFATKFEATKNGEPVRGVVCEGWFKGATVRFK